MNGGNSNARKAEKEPKNECIVPGISSKPGSARLVRRSKKSNKEEKQKVKSKDVIVTPLEQNTLQMRGYRLSYKLGEGSYANVYRTDYNAVVNGKPVSQILACKIIDAAKAPKDFVKKFLPRELEILNKINHPHLIHVHSIFQCKKKYFIFMRYAEEGDLLDYVLRRDIGENQARVWFRQLALAVQYLHTLDIVHRDIKCENVLITRNMNVKLADFGFSRSMDSKIYSCTYCGSLAYASPEILRGQPYCPKAADVWSLGVLLFVILNQSMPFNDANVKKLHQQQMCAQWNFRAKISKIVSDEVKNLVKAMLKADRMERLNINQVVDSEWIKMNPRLIPLNNQEKESLQKAMECQRIDTGVKTHQVIKYQLDNQKKFAPILVMTPSKIGLSSKFYRYSETAAQAVNAKSANVVQEKAAVNAKSANVVQEKAAVNAKSANVVQDRAAVTVIQEKNEGAPKISLTKVCATDSLLQSPDHKISCQNQTASSKGQNDKISCSETPPKNYRPQNQSRKSQIAIDNLQNQHEKSQNIDSKIQVRSMRSLNLQSDPKEPSPKSETHKRYHQSQVSQSQTRQSMLQKQQDLPSNLQEKRLKSQTPRSVPQEQLVKSQNLQPVPPKQLTGLQNLQHDHQEQPIISKTLHVNTLEHLIDSLILPTTVQSPPLVVSNFEPILQEPLIKISPPQNHQIGCPAASEKSQKPQTKDQSQQSDPQDEGTLNREQSILLTQLLKSQNLQSFLSMASKSDDCRSDFLAEEIQSNVQSSNYQDHSTKSQMTQSILSIPRMESRNPICKQTRNPEINALDQLKQLDQSYNQRDKSSYLITPFSRLSQIGKALELQLLPDLSLSRTLLMSNILDPLKQDSKGTSLTEIKAMDKSLDFQSNPTLNMIS